MGANYLNHLSFFLNFLKIMPMPNGGEVGMRLCFTANIFLGSGQVLFRTFLLTFFILQTAGCELPKTQVSVSLVGSTFGACTNSDCETIFESDAGMHPTAVDADGVLQVSEGQSTADAVVLSGNSTLVIKGYAIVASTSTCLAHEPITAMTPLKIKDVYAMGEGRWNICVAVVRKGRRALLRSPEIIVDLTSPLFTGVISVAGNNTLTPTLSWPTASDNYATASKIKYQVRVSERQMSTITDALTFGESREVQSGSIAVQMSDLNAGKTYYAVVIATDRAGNTNMMSQTHFLTGSGGGSSITSLSLARIIGNPGYMCAIVNGGVKCWGDGPLGDGNYDTVNGSFPSSPIPVTAIAANSGVTDLAISPGHACAVINGGLKCWGSDNQHQVGDSGANILDSSNNSGRTSPYQIIPENSGVTKVVLSAIFSCAIVDGGVQCWGENWHGQAGYGITGASVPGDALDDWVDTPVTAIASGSGVTDLIASHYHVCALLGDKLKCWGRNDFGQIGNFRDTNGDLAHVASPVTVISSGVSAFALGDLHTCAIVNGAVQCLGDNSRGQVGNSSSTAFLDSPTATSITSGATGLSLGPDYSCAVVNGGVKCWGSNSSGELGDGSAIDRNAPVVAIAAVSGVTAVKATTIFHRSDNGATTCAIVSGGLKCWGSNPGVIENNPPTTSPVQVIAANSGVQSIVVSSNYSTLRYSCAGLSNSVRCWGNNWSGVLGDGTTTDSVTPTVVNLSYASTTTTSAQGGP